MTAIELRIGNWVEIKPPVDGYSGICMVENIGRKYVFVHCEKDDYFIQKSIDDIRPIPITPEILEKCGFDIKHLDTYTLNFEDDWHLEVEDMGEEYTIWLYEDDKDNKLPIAVNYKYVHQLQNLYFALTGEELIIEL